MTKKTKLLLLVFLLVFAGFGLFYNRQIPPQTSNNEAVEGRATLVIDYGDGKKESASFTPRPEQTVFDALKSVTDEKGIILEIQQYDFGVFLKAIGEYPSTADKAWIYFVNGTSGTVAADKQQIKAGDLIEWRYIKPE